LASFPDHHAAAWANRNSWSKRKLGAIEVARYRRSLEPPISRLGGGATRAIGAAALLRKPFSPELFLLPGDYNSATPKKAVVSLESEGYRRGEALGFDLHLARYG
jgi:hypothetical protein